MMNLRYFAFLITCVLFPFSAMAQDSAHVVTGDEPPSFHATCRVTDSRKYSAADGEQKWSGTEKTLTTDVWAEFKYEQGDDFVTSVRAGLKRDIRYKDAHTILFEISEQGQISTYAVHLALKNITGVQIGASNKQGGAKTGARILQMSCEFH